MFANACPVLSTAISSGARKLLLTMVLAFVSMGAARAEAAPDFVAALETVIQRGNALADAYRAEDGLTSSDAFSDLYFDDFEASGLENAIARRDGGRKADLEGRFSQLISLSAKGAAQVEVVSAWEHLRVGLMEEQAVFNAASGGDSWWPSFSAAFLILLREGAEALLVVGALVAYVQRVGERKHMTMLYGAIFAAVVASFFTAWAIFTSVMGLDGRALEALEGLTMLLAAGVLLYVGHWLLSKREAERWQAYIHKHVDGAIESGSGVSLMAAVFLAVYREGAETVLFYQALIADHPDGGDAILSGFVLAALVLAGLFVAIRILGLRLPLKMFFTATAVTLGALAVVFVGKGVAELQVIRWVPATQWDGGFQVSWLGLFPTLESLGAQLAILVILALGSCWPLLRRRAS